MSSLPYVHTHTLYPTPITWARSLKRHTSKEKEKEKKTSSRGEKKQRQTKGQNLGLGKRAEGSRSLWNAGGSEFSKKTRREQGVSILLTARYYCSLTSLCC